MADLSDAVLASKNVTELYDAVANAIGMKAFKHFETLVMSQEFKEKRAAERDMVPWTSLDVDVLKRLQGAATLLNPTADPVTPWNRLAGIIEQMEDVRKRAERGW